VLWVQGGAARVISDEHRKAPLDVAIVGIIDSVDVDKPR
jgi:microcompartment protein CcmK/EutM